MNEEIIVKVGADISELGRKLGQANREVGGFGTKLGGVMKAAGAAVVAGTAVAGGAFVVFAKQAVTAAADAQAITAQFEQVFGDLGTTAQTEIDAMAKNFGMMPNRIKPSFTTMTSMFKGLGLDTESAMAQAASATTLAADAAAFYDKEFSEAQSALTSFIKGNYEGRSFAPCYGNVA